MSYSETVREIKNFEEASHLVGVPHHILHLWTKKFPLLQPKKTSSGELGFEPRDISFAKGLKYLLIDEQKPISAVQKIINERGVSYVSAYGKEQNQKKSVQGEVNRIFNAPQTIPEKTSFKKEKSSNAFESLKTLKSEMTQKLSLSLAKDMSSSLPSEEEVAPQPPQKRNASKDEKAFDSFESNWRKFMHNKGKAVTPQEVRAKRPEVSFEEDEILFIDEDVSAPDIFPSPQKAIDWPANYVITEEVKRPVNGQLKAAPAISDYQNGQGLSVETQEKMQHILSKLDILKSELTVTKDVIHKTLKAFGYSGFGDAYDKHDNKSAY